jgi:GT2 family glycosyltransferase
MIGLVLVTYAHWPGKLMRSIHMTSLPVRWYIHHHGPEPRFADRIWSLSAVPNFSVHMHGHNRGLARSWNEGIHEAYADGCELVLLLNDDLHFINNGFRSFVEYARANDEYALAFLHGLETGGSHLAGKTIDQGFGCCVITRLALERIGYLDENFRPAYFEDVDYGRRCYISGARIISTSEVLVEHERGKTSRDNPEIAAKIQEEKRLNETYFMRKWGANDEFRIPFNDARFTTRIDWSDRADPYPGYSRDDGS